jgi:hypothetical protein
MVNSCILYLYISDENQIEHKYMAHNFNNSFIMLHLLPPPTHYQRKKFCSLKDYVVLWWLRHVLSDLTTVFCEPQLFLFNTEMAI